MDWGNEFQYCIEVLQLGNVFGDVSRLAHKLKHGFVFCWRYGFKSPFHNGAIGYLEPESCWMCACIIVSRETKDVKTDVFFDMSMRWVLFSESGRAGYWSHPVDFQAWEHGAWNMTWPVTWHLHWRHEQYSDVWMHLGKKVYESGRSSSICVYFIWPSSFWFRLSHILAQFF